MLDVSRIGDGRLPLEYQEVDLVVVVRDMVNRLAKSAAEVGSAVEITAATPLVGRWDRMRVEQVVTNLLSNAIKYGGGKPIALAVDGDDRHARVVVKDRGIGILPAHQRRIFDRFERAVPLNNYAGFGLGLWICRRIVDALGGEISVESSPGEGSTFTVVLPRRPAKEMAALDPDAEPEPEVARQMAAELVSR
jgi:signal transduction histidine kinase